MFDIGWSEMAIIALVALVVLGPKQLPQAMKSFAQFSRKMRRYAQEFRAGVDNIVREAELEDAKKALASLQTRIPTLTVVATGAPAGAIRIRIDNDSPDAAPKKGPVMLNPGQHVLVVEAPLPLPPPPIVSTAGEVPTVVPAPLTATPTAATAMALTAPTSSARARSTPAQSPSPPPPTNSPSAAPTAKPSPPKTDEWGLPEKK